MSELEQQGPQDPPAPPDEIDTLPGVVHFAAVVVQCLRCVEQGREGVLRAQLEERPEPDDLDNVEIHAVPCPACSSELGRPVAVPVAIFVGENVDKVFGDDGEGGFSESDIAASEAAAGLGGGDAGDGS